LYWTDYRDKLSVFVPFFVRRFTHPVHLDYKDQFVDDRKDQSTQVQRIGFACATACGGDKRA
jgi:hypothetical protein